MSAGKILRIQGPLTTDKVRNVTAAALNRVKLNTGMSNKALAERMGKEDRKTAENLLNGESTMDLTAFLKLLADEDFDAAFANDIITPLVGLTVADADGPTDAAIDALPVALSQLLTTLLLAVSDKRLSHPEYLSLAKLLRPLMPHFTAIIAEADRIAA